jgi:protein TonB
MNMQDVAIDLGFRYGAPELKQAYQKYLTIAEIIGILVTAGFLGAYYLGEYLAREEEPVAVVRIMKYSELGPPPSIQSSNVPPAISVAAPAVRPSVGIPVPVPDAEVSPEQTFATQQEMNAATEAIGEGTGAGGEVTIEKDIKIEDDGPPPDFVPYEKAPQVIKRVNPVYPEIARKAGLEGTVYVKIWVDKQGRAKKVVIQKSASDIFDQAAIDAAMQFVFTPAMMQNGPVDVWVSIPFHFRLK